ncbi:MAG: Glucose-6-phosphate 1-dehydrogenase [Myxococcaceae bacterium]|nr:Glucose-6-phosphate 1-dehydrogenase [Myxococcaceae bacterium]
MSNADNPLRVGLETERTPEPCVFVIFGASGDLTKRKLIPALYNLAVSRLLPPGLSIVGVAMTELSTEDFRKEKKAQTAEFSRRKPLEEAVWDDFASRLHYVSGKFGELSTFEKLRAQLEELDKTNGTRGNRIYYLAIPPSLFTTVNDNLAKAGLVADPADKKHYTRIIVEKPFGHDLASGDALNADLHRVFAEEQIFRIDHYLGKETVQNLMALRFGNEIFEPLWNRNHVDHIQITVAEDIGVEGRGKFYEEAGTTRDIVQNHLLQLLMVTCMEPPIDFAADPVRDEKVKVLRALHPIAKADVNKLTVRGQYTTGSFAGKPVCGYREEENVSKTSNVETFVAMKLNIDSWRWAGVPIYIRAGKRLTQRVTEISIHFKAVPHNLMAKHGAIEPDVLSIRIQPDEGITLSFASKVPGPRMMLRPVNMDFRYGTTFGGSSPEAYERLILDAMLGDPTLFARSDEVSAAWKFITPILEAWKECPPPEPYRAGTWGPPSAAALLEKDGRHWRRL